MGLGGEEGENADNKVKLLDADLLIVDEFSMVDMWLAQQMFQRVRASCRIVLVGDPDQLPSVGAGRVFASMIKSGKIPVTVLDQTVSYTHLDVYKRQDCYNHEIKGGA